MQRRQRTHGVRLDRDDGRAVRENRELVVLALGTEDLPAGERRDAGLDALLAEELGRLDGDGDLGAGRDDGDVGLALDLVEDVATLVGVLDRRARELGEVLAGEREDGRGVRRGERDVVRRRGLVAVCMRRSSQRSPFSHRPAEDDIKDRPRTSRAPDVAVGERAEVSDGLNRLVSRAVLAETDPVHTVARQDCANGSILVSRRDRRERTRRRKTHESWVATQMTRRCERAARRTAPAAYETKLRKVPMAGIMRLGPYAAMPLAMAPMPCSRTP